MRAFYCSFYCMILCRSGVREMFAGSRNVASSVCYTRSERVTRRPENWLKSTAEFRISRVSRSFFFLFFLFAFSSSRFLRRVTATQCEPIVKIARIICESSCVYGLHSFTVSLSGSHTHTHTHTRTRHTRASTHV